MREATSLLVMRAADACNITKILRKYDVEAASRSQASDWASVVWQSRPLSEGAWLPATFARDSLGEDSGSPAGAERCHNCDPAG